jgi:hypothetical protein
MAVLWEVDLPCSPLPLMNNKSYFPFLKTLLSLFVNCGLALKPGDWFSGNSRSVAEWLEHCSPCTGPWVLPPALQNEWMNLHGRHSTNGIR